MSDILDIDLKAVDPSFPVFKKGIYQLKLTDVEIKENESKTMMLTFETLGPVESDKGESLESARAFDNINLAATGRAKPDMIVRNVAGFLQSLPNGADGWTIRRLYTDHKQLTGSIVKARVGIQPAGPDKNGTHRAARNTIEEYLKP